MHEQSVQKQILAEKPNQLLPVVDELCLGRDGLLSACAATDLRGTLDLPGSGVYLLLRERHAVSPTNGAPDLSGETRGQRRAGPGSQRGRRTVLTRAPLAMDPILQLPPPGAPSDGSSTSQYSPLDR
jgi:hypothetical protein